MRIYLWDPVNRERHCGPHFARNNSRQFLIRLNQQKLVRGLHFQPLFESFPHQRQGSVKFSCGAEELCNQVIEFELPGLRFWSVCAYVDTAALPKLEPATPFKLPVAGTNGIGVQTEASCQFASAG